MTDWTSSMEATINTSALEECLTLSKYCGSTTWHLNQGSILLEFCYTNPFLNWNSNQSFWQTARWFPSISVSLDCSHPVKRCSRIFFAYWFSQSKSFRRKLAIPPCTNDQSCYSNYVFMKTTWYTSSSMSQLTFSYFPKRLPTITSSIPVPPLGPFLTDSAKKCIKCFLSKIKPKFTRISGWNSSIFVSVSLFELLKCYPIVVA